MAFISASAIANSLVSWNYFKSDIFFASVSAKSSSVFNLASLTAVSVFLSIVDDARDVLFLVRDLVLVRKPLLERFEGPVLLEIALFLVSGIL